jgi:hypothetical protein
MATPDQRGPHGWEQGRECRAKKSLVNGHVYSRPRAQCGIPPRGLCRSKETGHRARGSCSVPVPSFVLGLRGTTACPVESHHCELPATTYLLMYLEKYLLGTLSTYSAESVIQHLVMFITWISHPLLLSSLFFTQHSYAFEKVSKEW